MRPYVVTPVAEGPFEIRQTRYVFKPLTRPVPVVGPWITGVTADETLGVLVDGTGLGDRNGDRLFEHSTQKDAMRLMPLTQAAEGLVFDLNGTYTLESLQIWNYNEPGYTGRGAAQADVAVWTEQNGWKTVLRQASLTEAEGTNDYDEPTLLTFAPVRAQKVRLENLVPFADEGLVGLGAIRFYESATHAACNPMPAVDAELPGTRQMTLAWTPGKEAAAYDVYAAAEGHPLTLLGRISQSQVNVAGLAGGRRYTWRVDAVRKDGAVTAGPEWAFGLKEGVCVGQWSFSEGGGTAASDGSGLGHHGALKGEPAWVDGKIGSAIDFDGKAGHIGVSDADALRVGRGDYTICAWVYPRAVSGCRGIVTKVRDSVNKEYALSLEDGALTLEVETSGNNGRAATAPVIATEQWQHVAVVFDSSTLTPAFYVNGQLQETVSDTITELPVFLSSNLSIGRWGGNYDSRYFDGMIDEVYLYSCALSGQQITALAEGQQVEWMASDAPPTLTLAGAELLDRGADLKAVAEGAPGEEVASQSFPGNLIPVLIIIAVIIVAAVVMRKKKSV